MQMNPLVPELYCSDIQKSLDFYCNILGFAIVYDRPEAKFAYIQREGVQLMIEELTENDRKWLSGPLEKPFGRGINLQMVTSSIDSLYETLRKHGIPLFMDIEEKWYRRAHDTVGNRQFAVQDPDGYLLRFSQTVGTKPNV
jgi:catechol 2,3-dioxygenase-like lactoylglutathione lyase family enzyme